MSGDITIFINPCGTEENHKKYNRIILKVMEESRLDYNIHTPSSRLQGLIKVELNLKDEDPKKYGAIGNSIKARLEAQMIEVKKILDFRGNPYNFNKSLRKN